MPRVRNVKLTARPRLLRDLSAMPDCDNPNGLACDAVEAAVWGDDDLSIRKIRELWKDATGFGEPLEPAQHDLSTLLEPPGGGRILAKVGRDDVKEPPSAGWCKADLHRQASASSRSASARTSSRS